MTERALPWLRVGFRIVFASFALFVATIGVKWLVFLFSPFLLAIVMATLLHTGVSSLERHLPWSRKGIVLWIIAFLFLIGMAMLWVVVPYIWGELRSLIQLWERVLPDFIGLLEYIDMKSGDFLPMATGSWLEQLGGLVTSFLASCFEKLGKMMVEIPAFMVQCIVFTMATYFFTCDYPKYLSFWKKKVEPDAIWLAARVKSTVVTAFGGYLKTQALLSVGVFFIVFVGFLCMKQSFALVLALGIAFLDFIPMIGAGLVLLPWVLCCAVLGESTKAVILFLLWCATALFRRLFEPKILGEQTGLSPLLSLGSMYVGLQVAGVWGLIFAPVVVLVVMHFFGVSVFRGLIDDLEQIGLDILMLFEEN